VGMYDGSPRETAERLEDDSARRRRLKREGEVVVDANSDGASEGEVRSVSRRAGSQLFDSGDNTGHRVVEVLVACPLQDALFHVLAERP
jgi:hypothetical protein